MTNTKKHAPARMSHGTLLRTIFVLSVLAILTPVYLVAYQNCNRVENEWDTFQAARPTCSHTVAEMQRVAHSTAPEDFLELNNSWWQSAYSPNFCPIDGLPLNKDVNTLLPASLITDGDDALYSCSTCHRNLGTVSIFCTKDGGAPEVTAQIPGTFENAYIAFFQYRDFVHSSWIVILLLVTVLAFFMGIGVYKLTGASAAEKSTTETHP